MKNKKSKGGKGRQAPKKGKKKKKKDEDSIGAPAINPREQKKILQKAPVESEESDSGSSSEEEQAPTSAYNSLLSTLSGSSKYKDLIQARIKEQQGKDVDDEEEEEEGQQQEVDLEEGPLDSEEGEQFLDEENEDLLGDEEDEEILSEDGELLEGEAEAVDDNGPKAQQIEGGEGEQGDEEEEDPSKDRENLGELEQEDHVQMSDLNAAGVEAVEAGDPFTSFFGHSMTMQEAKAAFEAKVQPQFVTAPSLGPMVTCERSPMPEIKGPSLSEYNVKPRLIKQWNALKNPSDEPADDSNSESDSESEEEEPEDWKLLSAEELDKRRKKRKYKRAVRHLKKNAKRQKVEKAPVKSHPLTPLQSSMLSVMTSYRDLLFPNQTWDNIREIREAYVMHAVNHVIKCRDQFLTNTAQINKANEEGVDPPECRDQGFTRPKVLILCPLKNSAYEIADLILKLSPWPVDETDDLVRRFRTRYSIEGLGLTEDVPKATKPADWNKQFAGNIDDCFRLGISFTRDGVHLYSQFYHADIILASPLGLRLILGAPGEKGRDIDFLSSLEMVICDQTDVFTMQNWEHVNTIFDAMNRLPKSTKNTDFSRIREFHLNKMSKYYRQTLVFTSLLTPQINNLFNRSAFNHQGKVRVRKEYEGTISQVVLQIRQVFQRMEPKTLDSANDFRFEYFTQHVFPKLRSSTTSQVLIFISSYIDYVRVRNFLSKEEVSFESCNEYMANSEIARSRTMLLQGRCKFLLFTERFHFFKRLRIRGVKGVVFYSLPEYPHFYPEIMNLIENQEANSIALYSKFDVLKLERIAGTKRTQKMLTSDKTTHMFC